METRCALSERRSIRRFTQEIVPDNVLAAMFEAASQTSCAGNQQRLRYVAARSAALVKAIFVHTAWGALVKPRRNPEPGVTSPTVFIAVTAPAGLPPIIHADAGAAIQSMQLAAWDAGFGCCWLGAFDRAAVSEILNLPADREILYLLAVGRPAESPVSEPAKDGNVKYYLDDNDRIHVPKLPVAKVVDWR